MTDCIRLCVWSGPRNISTALMYAFRQRSDTTVVDEPFYGHYLAATGLRHPGYADVLAATETDADLVIRAITTAPCPKRILFIKNMAHHLVGLDLSFLDSLTNVLLTRDPRQMLVSLTKEIPDADLEATGLPGQIRILERIEAAGKTPIVLDSTEILCDPEAILRTLCARLQIPFEDSMLSWPPGPKPEDGVWAPHWYGNVHRSTGFAPNRPRDEALPERLSPLLASCRPLYDRLAAHAIRSRASG